MYEFSLTYNPFQAVIEFQDKGERKELNCFGTGENKPLQEWLYAFFPELAEKYNIGEGSECKIAFSGTPGDYEDLCSAGEDFKKANPGVEIMVEHLNPESKRMSDRLSRLKALFKEMQKQSYYEELKDPKYKPLFDKAVNSEFEISVVATMSSGKSTLVNALLGQEVLPARNEATTAKIARIKDVKGSSGFRVRGFKRNEQEELIPATEEQEANLDILEQLNGDPNIAVIGLSGNISKIDSKEMQLVLSDTPGPNNSGDATHRKHIDDLLKEDTYKPMIMYILNATQLEIEDDKKLLDQISEAMKKSGKQGKDRFLFVLNKADDLDSEKGESVKKKVIDCKKYLKGFGIDGARIFPASGRLAKVIRKVQSGGEELTRKEKAFLGENVSLFIEEKELHLSDFSELSPSCKKQQEGMLQKAAAENDENTQALIYSGIPAIELAVNEYLEKYAITAKISEAVSVFNKTVKKLDLKNKTEEKLSSDEQAREEVCKALDAVQALLKEGREGRELSESFDKKIEEINKSLDSSFNEHQKAVDRFLDKEAEPFRQKEEASEQEAEALVEKIKKNMEARHKTLCDDLTKSFNKELNQQAQQYLDDYRNHIKMLIEKGFMNKEGYAVSALNLVQLAIPHSAADLVEEYSEEREIESKETVKNKNKKWYKPWTWGQSAVVEIDISTTVVSIKLKDLYEKRIQPQSLQFTNTLRDAKTAAKANAEGLKEFFKKEISRLENIIQEEAGKEAEKLKSREALDLEIKKNEEKAEWLNGFIEELNGILSI